MQRISWLAANNLASQEGLCSTEYGNMPYIGNIGLNPNIVVAVMFYSAAGILLTLSTIAHK
jgi:hypothetical protein